MVPIYHCDRKWLWHSWLRSLVSMSPFDEKTRFIICFICKLLPAIPLTSTHAHIRKLGSYRLTAVVRSFIVFQPITVVHCLDWLLIKWVRKSSIMLHHNFANLIIETLSKKATDSKINFTVQIQTRRRNNFLVEFKFIWYFFITLRNEAHLCLKAGLQS